MVAHGVVGLLPARLRERAEIVADLGALESAIAAAPVSAVIDAESTAAEQAVSAVVARGGSVALLLASAEQQPDLAMLEHANAILLRDELDPAALCLALAAGSLGMQLLPRPLPRPRPHDRDQGCPPLSADGRRVLALLAEGMRDAEIARELSLSESAARKLVQRTVRSVGARTRCQAVAIVARLLG